MVKPCNDSLAAPGCSCDLYSSAINVELSLYGHGRGRWTSRHQDSIQYISQLSRGVRSTSEILPYKIPLISSNPDAVKACARKTGVRLHLTELLQGMASDLDDVLAGL